VVLTFDEEWSPEEESLEEELLDLLTFDEKVVVEFLNEFDNVYNNSPGIVHDANIHNNHGYIVIDNYDDILFLLVDVNVHLTGRYLHLGG